MCQEAELHHHIRRRFSSRVLGSDHTPGIRPAAAESEGAPLRPSAAQQRGSKDLQMPLPAGARLTRDPPGAMFRTCEIFPEVSRA